MDGVLSALLSGVLVAAALVAAALLAAALLGALLALDARPADLLARLERFGVAGVAVESAGA